MKTMKKLTGCDLLKTSKDVPEICGKITELVAMEDRLTETENKLKECQENHGQKIVEWGGAIGAEVSSESSLLGALERLVEAKKVVESDKEDLEEVIKELGEEIEHYKEEVKYYKARRNLDKFTRIELLKEFLRRWLNGKK